MNRVARGLLMGVGAGAVTGSVVLLMRGEKTQRFLRERWQQLRSALPAPAQVQQYAQHVAEQVSQAASEVKDTAQQAVKKVRDAGSDLGELAQHKAMTMKQTGQDGGANSKQMVNLRIYSSRPSTSSVMPFMASGTTSSSLKILHRPRTGSYSRMSPKNRATR